MRIVSGQFRGRTLATPKDAKTIRPTGDRVRETIFNVLGQRCDGLSVLDLFAGTGALAFEALSRGATNAVLVDTDREAIALCHDNAKQLQCEAQCQIVRSGAFEALGRFEKEGAQFHLLFVDPPYALQQGARLLESLGRVSASGAMLIYEHSSDEDSPSPSGSWQSVDIRRFGITTVSFFRWNA